ncbi:MAG: hypothetical protein ACQKBW_11175, partial [Puniceicoccales bacterium]
MRALTALCTCLLLTFLPAQLPAQDAAEQPQTASQQAPTTVQGNNSAADTGTPQAGEDESTANSATAAAITTAETLNAESNAQGQNRQPAKEKEAPKDKLDHIHAPFVLEGGYWNISIFGFTTGQLTVSFIVLLFSVIFRNIIAAFIFRRIRALTTKTRVEFDDHIIDALEKPVSWFILCIGIYVSLAILPLDTTIALLIQNMFHGGTMLLIVWAMLRLTDVFANVLGGRIKDKKSAL